jgi:alcohol dehydrogenase
MKAAVVPAVHGKWEVREVPTPQPGPNQVLIKIHASGLCYTDVHITEGALPTQFPRTLGHEPVGEIVALGEGVRTRQIGDRVGVPWVQAGCGRCEWCLRGKLLFCAQQTDTGIHTQGSHAEYMLAYADSTALLPEGLSYEQAAPILCAGYTVWSGLRIAEPKPHERIAVVGVGGLGHLGVQYAKAAGFETIAVSHSKDKEKFIRDLGADEVVADGKALRSLGGADVILATSNSWSATADALTAIRPDGRASSWEFRRRSHSNLPLISCSRERALLVPLRTDLSTFMKRSTTPRRERLRWLPKPIPSTTSVRLTNA